MTETPDEQPTNPDQVAPTPGDGDDVLHDGELPAPYPDDTPGGVQDGNQDSDGTADLAGDAEQLTAD